MTINVTNWKTTLIGIASLLGVVAKIVTTGQFDWSTDGPAIMAAIGVILAKDFDVTGIGTNARHE